MAVNYLQDYLGINPNDYSAMEQGIAGISPLAPGQSIIPQTASMPRASIMSEGDFANATAPLMNRVYGREQESRATADGLANQLQGLQSNLQEVTQLRDRAVQDYQDSLQQQDIMRQQAAEDQARQLEEQRNSLLQEREGIITTLEQDFGVQRSELESVIGGLEGQVGDLTSKVGELESVRGNLQGEIDNLSSQMQSLEVEKQDALAQQDVIRAESAQAQQDALTQQGEQFATEKSALEQQIADLTAQVGQQQPPEVTIVEDGPPSTMIPGGGTPGFYDREPPPSKRPPQIFIDDGPGFRDEKIGMPPSINEGMPPATSEGGLPEGYSYKPGPGSEGFSYTTVMPTPGYRYAYGPDGKRIEVPDNRTGGTGGMPIAKPIDTIIKPPQVPPKDLGPLPPGVPVKQPPSVGGPVVRPGGPVPILATGREELERNNPILPVQNTQLPVANPRNPSMFEEIEKKIAEAGGSKITYPTQTAKPIFQKTPKMVPTQKPMSIGGVGGRSSGRRMRPTFRAGGGAIGQAIADLQNRLR